VHHQGSAAPDNLSSESQAGRLFRGKGTREHRSVTSSTRFRAIVTIAL
jgi:hypothetical protein